MFTLDLLLYWLQNINVIFIYIIRRGVILVLFIYITWHPSQVLCLMCGLVLSGFNSMNFPRTSLVQHGFFVRFTKFAFFFLTYQLSSSPSLIFTFHVYNFCCCACYARRVKFIYIFCSLIITVDNFLFMQKFYCFLRYYAYLF